MRRKSKQEYVGRRITLKEKRRVDKKKLIKWIAIGAIAAYGIVTLILQIGMMNNAQSENAKLSAQLQTKSEAAEALKKKESALNNDEDRDSYIEGVARDQLGLVHKEETVFYPETSTKSEPKG